ncbi:MAG: hypothetical protein AB1813_11895 [Verrucomicrobiota bacterium]|jgi:hypothetical protein
MKSFWAKIIRCFQRTPPPWEPRPELFDHPERLEEIRRTMLRRVEKKIRKLNQRGPALPPLDATDLLPGTSLLLVIGLLCSAWL